MSTPLKFEFDFDEVFEGIKLGVMKEMSEMTFDGITSSAVNQIKSEMKNKIALTYKDEHDIKDEIKKEIKDKVYQTLITEIRDNYKKQYDAAFGDDVKMWTSQYNRNPFDVGSILYVVSLEKKNKKEPTGEIDPNTGKKIYVKVPDKYEHWLGRFVLKDKIEGEEDDI